MKIGQTNHVEQEKYGVFQKGLEDNDDQLWYRVAFRRPVCVQSASRVLDYSWRAQLELWKPPQIIPTLKCLHCFPSNSWASTNVTILTGKQSICQEWICGQRCHLPAFSVVLYWPVWPPLLKWVIFNSDWETSQILATNTSCPCFKRSPSQHIILVEFP